MPYMEKLTKKKIIKFSYLQIQYCQKFTCMGSNNVPNI